MRSSRAPQPGASAQTVAVVGAGVVGLCTALQAQRQGYRVTLIDRDAPGQGASFGNAGYLATELIDPLSSGKTLRGALAMLLDPHGPLALPLGYLHRSLPWLLRFVAAARPAQVARSRDGLLALNRAALPAWRRCLADIGASQQLRQSGYLLVWESAGRLEEARAHARYLQQWGVHSELVDAARVAQLEPALAGTVKHALYFPEACQVREPYELCRQLFAAFEARGGCFVQQAVEHLSADAQQVRVQIAGTALSVDRAVICAGAWSKKLLQGTGIEVPLEAERGYHLSLDSPVIRLNRPIGSAERRFVISPLDSGLRAVGFTELGGLRLKPIRRRGKTLRRHSQALIPALADPSLQTSEWMGHRPTLPDSLPVIDRHPQHARLLFAFGNQHLGLTQAAISAELVVSLMAGETPPIDLRPYRVDRF
ncbi:FAD-dependent oxidoreductase [Pseudomonas sp. sp1636]|uniref:NAD(P)/FAD-dependent oxidoreductase n=1 Tax=Pseudomonas sp. sp1636 TaxID=3036707 RepID=UPI0025A638F1|nr:FAD-dependent oxidoreductase [Pseudomonas sp. sp1636]MDM8347298.1 FAD-dependent oxidoreductase [Pseudomonas sp. sp1636]